MSNYYKKGFVVISSPPVKGDTNRFVRTVKFIIIIIINLYTYQLYAMRIYTLCG